MGDLHLWAAGIVIVIGLVGLFALLKWVIAELRK